MYFYIVGLFLVTCVFHTNWTVLNWRVKPCQVVAHRFKAYETRKILKYSNHSVILQISSISCIDFLNKFNCLGYLDIWIIFWGLSAILPVIKASYSFGKFILLSKYTIERNKIFSRTLEIYIFPKKVSWFLKILKSFISPKRMNFGHMFIWTFWLPLRCTITFWN